LANAIGFYSLPLDGVRIGVGVKFLGIRIAYPPPTRLIITHKWGSGLFNKFLVAQVFNLCEGFWHSLERLCHQAEKLMGKDKRTRRGGIMRANIFLRYSRDITLSRFAAAYLAPFCCNS
jgi:hypothetical protein